MPEDWEEPWKEACGSMDARGPLQLSVRREREIMKTGHVFMLQNRKTAPENTVARALRGPGLFESGDLCVWNALKHSGAKGILAISDTCEF